MARAIRPTQSSSSETTLPRPVLLGLFFLTSLAVGIIISILGPTVPAIAARLHVRESDLGAVFGATYLVGALSTPVFGRIFDLVGPRLIFPLGLIVLAIGALGEGLATTLPAMTVAGAVAGMGIGINTITNNVAAGSLFPERRDAVLNGLNALFGAGAFLAPLLASSSLARLNDYTPVYVLAAIVLLLPALPLLIGLPRGRPAAVSLSTDAPTRTVLAEPLLWAHAALSFLYLGAEIGFGGWIVAVVQHSAHLSLTAAAPIASIFWLFLALGGVPTALLLRRGVAAARLVSVGAAGAALASLLLIVGGGAAPLATLAAALVGLSFAPILPLNVSAALRLVELRAPGAVGGATAVVLTAAEAGAAIIPALQGQLLRAGPMLAVAMTCLCSLLMLAIQRGIMRFER